MFKKLRIAILLFVLANVAFSAWLTRARTTDWDEPLRVVVFAMNGDGSAASQAWVDELVSKDREAIDKYFSDLESFFAREAKRHGLTLEQPVDMRFGGEIEGAPPLPPRGGSTLSIMAWSLKLRYWAWRVNDYTYRQDAQIYVRYHDPEQFRAVAHSLGLQKGLIGVVNGFAGKKMRRENHVVIAHELLHTVGATDKYDPRTNLPLYPIGYAHPDRDPVLPQDHAEIMAGRYAVSEHEAVPARRLKRVVIGPETALEIRWTAGR